MPRPLDLHRRILALAIPAIVTNITTPLLAMVDVAIVGHMGSAIFIAAIAVGGTMFNMLYWLLGFLRMGTSGITAQSFGASDRTGQMRVLHIALAIALAMGCLLVMLSRPLGHLSLRLMDPDVDTAAPALHYFLIAIWGAPAVLSTYAMTGWLLGLHDSKAGMWISLVINLSNIAISVALVYLAGLGIRGVAAGTMSAQWVGAAVAFRFCRAHGFRIKPVELRKNIRKLSMRALYAGLIHSRFLRVNMYIFLRTLCLVAVTVWFTRIGSMQGAITLAINTLIMQLFILFSYFMDGFAYAGEALAGTAVGAHNSRELKSVCRSLLFWGTVLAMAASALYLAGGEWLLGLLSDFPEVVAGASEYIPWAATIPLVGFGAFVWDGIYIGATESRGMLAGVGGGALVFFSSYILFYPHLGNHGLWLAFTLYLLSRTLIQTMLAHRLFARGA